MINTKRYVYSQIGNQLVLWVNPRTISFFVGTKWPVTKKIQESIYALPKVPRVTEWVVSRIRDVDPYVIPARFYREPIPIEKSGKYQKVKNLIENRHDLPSTVWYKNLINDLQESGVATHKEILMYSEEEIVEFFHTYVFDLVDSMAADGYDMEKGRDIGSALVGSDGKLHKSGSGIHRYSVARILGIASFPVKIAGVHKDWYLNQKKRRGHMDVNQLAEALIETERANQ